MRRLIASEFKKLLKNKLNILVLLAITGFMTYTTWDCYHEELPVERLKGSIMKTFDGKELSDLNDVYRYADQVLSQYEGKATPEMWKRYCDDFNRYHEEFTKEIDTAIMIDIYGPDYKHLFEKLSHPMEEDEFSNYVDQYDDAMSKYIHGNQPMFYHYDPNTKTGSFPVFYKHQAELSTLNLIYLNYYDDIELNGQLLSDENNLALPLYLLSHKEEQLTHLIIHGETDQIKTYNTFIRQTLAKQDQSYGSNASMNPLEASFSRFSFLSLLVIPIILANSFAIEKKSRIDQIIIPSREGYVNIAAAKIIAGSLLGVMTMVLQIICIFVIAYLVLKPEGWNLPMMNQVQGYGNLTGVNTSYMTYATYFIGRIQLLIISALAISFTTLFLSAITKNQFVTVITNLLFIMLPFFYSDTLPAVMQKILPCFMTYNNDYFFYTGDISHSFLVKIFDHTFWWKDVASIFWIAIVIFITIIMLLLARRNYVSNK